MRDRTIGCRRSEESILLLSYEKRRLLSLSTLRIWNFYTYYNYKFLFPKKDSSARNSGNQLVPVKSHNAIITPLRLKYAENQSLCPYPWLQHASFSLAYIIFLLQPVDVHPTPQQPPSSAHLRISVLR